MLGDIKVNLSGDILDIVDAIKWHETKYMVRSFLFRHGVQVLEGEGRWEVRHDDIRRAYDTQGSAYEAAFAILDKRWEG